MIPKKGIKNYRNIFYNESIKIFKIQKNIKFMESQ